MTKYQEYKISYIKENVIKEIYGSCYNDYEIKNFKVTESEYDIVSIMIILGLKNDENTLATMTRKYALLFIGKQGSLKHVSSKNHNLKKTKSLYQAFADYSY